MKKLYIAAFIFSFLILACSNTSKQTVESVDEHTQGHHCDNNAVPAVIPKAAQHSSSIPATDNQMGVDQMIPEVELHILEPAENQVYAPGEEITVRVDLKRYEIGDEIGQHIHVILDNQDYAAHYSTEKIILKDLSPGTHSLRIFPARHYHLSLKTPGVFKQVTFHVGEKSENYSFDPQKPYITYSRPKGTYSLEAGKKGLLLDFYVQNTNLGLDSRVIYAVNGKEFVLNAWEPVFLPPLEKGKHKIALKLVDLEGNLIVNGDFNDNLREIEVK